MSSGKKGLIINPEISGMDYAIKKAYEVIESGGIISYPTETLYGLGVRYDNEISIKRLIELKGRAVEKGIPLITGSIESINRLVKKIPPQINQLIERFWPGPLTILFDAKDELSPILTGGTKKIAIRIPAKSFAYELVSRYNLIITATSANPSNLPPASNIDMLMEYFNGLIDLMIDGGTLMGKPSTIIGFEEGNLYIIREGAIPRVDILREYGKISSINKNKELRYVSL